MSSDTILHLRDRLEVFREVARVLIPTGKFLFTDAGVITGAISGEEIQLRAVHGHTQFVPRASTKTCSNLLGLEALSARTRLQVC